jgi:hypothetical protein
MTVVSQYDPVRLLQPVEADIIDVPPSRIVMPAGSEGVVVHIHGPATRPLAYEVEFFIETMDAGAIATVEADLVVRAQR